MRFYEGDKTEYGKKIVNTQCGVLLEVRKKATSAPVFCHIFVVSDALANFVNRDLSTIQH